MKKLTKFLLILILSPIILLALFLTGFFMGRTHEIRAYENQIDLTFEAAAQQYKTYYHDSTKFDHYGNLRTKADTLKRVLPETSRTEIAKPSTGNNKKQSGNTRKRY